MKKLYIRHASELVTCRGKAPRRGREMADIGLIEDGAVLLSDGRIEAVGTTTELDLRLGLPGGRTGRHRAKRPARHYFKRMGKNGPSRLC